jgi:uncharacterized repeat protein (TIGR02543 family)
MKKGIYAVLAILTVFALVLGVTSCGGGGSDSPKDITITFDWGGGTYTGTIDPAVGIKIKENSTLGDKLPGPDVLKKAGATLSNDWKDSNNNVVNASTKIKKSTKLTAQWLEGLYTVTFDLNGGSGTAPKEISQKKAGEAITLPAGTGLTGPAGTPFFAGWSETKTGTAIATATYTPKEDKTLYAVWSATEVVATVTYDANGATSGTVPAKVTTTLNAVITLAGNTGSLAKDGFTWDGWSTTATGAKIEGGSYTVGAVDVTLYAVWKANEDAEVDNSIVEEIGLANGWAVIFQFVLPEGKVWEDYKELTAEHKLADKTTPTRARVWGNYVQSEVDDAHFGQYNGQNFAVVGSWPGGSSGRWIWDNTYAGITAADTMLATAVPPPADNAWFKVTYTIDGTKAHAQWNGHDNAANALEGREPKPDDKGPFYIGVGLSTNSTEAAVVSQIKNVTLVGYDETIDDIIGIPLYYKNGDTLYRAFVGQLDGDKNVTTGLYPNLNNGMPSWKIISGEDKIKAAATTGEYVPAGVDNVKITFKSNYDGGPADTDVTIVKGEKLTSTPVLTRDGYTFLGWYKEAAATNKIGADDTYSVATTLYAGWQEFSAPAKVTVDGTDLEALIAPAWGAKKDDDGFIIMADGTWNGTNGANANDSLLNISFPADLDPGFNMFRIYYDYKEIEAPTLSADDIAAGWKIDAAGIAKKFNSGDNAGNPGSYFSFNQSGGVLDRTFNANVTTTTGMSIQINKGDDADNKQKRAGLVYGIKITKIEFVYRISTTVSGTDLAALIAPAWGAKEDDGFIIMAGADWNNTDHSNNNDSLINISFPADLDPTYDKFIITYDYKLVEAPTLSADDIAAGWKIDAAGIAKKFNSGDNAGNPGSYFSFSQTGGALERTINANVTLTSGMSIQINKGDDSDNKQKRVGLVYGIKITKIEFFFEAPAAP